MTDGLVRTVRRAIYAELETTGDAPAVADVARVCGLAAPSVAAAYRELAASHVVVLQPGTLDLWSAPPFSAVATAFRVHARARSWYAPCAWDAFGIPAALGCDARIEARSGWTGEPIPCGVAHARPYGEGVIHLAVPAARFWDDIVFT